MTVRGGPDHAHRPAYSEPVIAGRPTKCLECGKRIVYVPAEEHRTSYWRAMRGRRPGDRR